MKNNFYMASSANGIHELNPVLCIAVRAGNLGLSRPLEISRFGHTFHVLHPLFTKLFRSRWLDIRPIRFCKCLFIDLDFVSVHNNATK